jgi:hypothetical protein
MPEEHTGPYIQIAVLCEKVLQENTGHMSLIRITDQLQIAGVNKDMQPMPVMLYAVVAFKAGFAHGKFRVKIVGTTPSKTEFVASEQATYFEGEDRGVNVVFVLNMVLPEEGVFWFDVLLEGTFVTRVPLRITYQQISVPPGFGPPG